MLTTFVYVIGFIGVTVGLGVSIWTVLDAREKTSSDCQPDEE